MTERLRSGIAPLDELLDGGLPAGAINLITGPPGSGKTMLAHQYLFGNATAERPGIYLSTVSEPFEKVIRYGQTLSFFDPRMVGREVFFEDLAVPLLTGGLDAVLGSIDQLVRTHRPGIVVIDSFKPFAAYADDHRGFRSFLHGIAGRLTATNASTFWIGEYDAEERVKAPEFAVADAVISLERSEHRTRSIRELRVLKLRGSGFASGAHAYRLSADGLRVFPRLADPVEDEAYTLDLRRTSSGVGVLDEMLEQGYIGGTSTICAGPTGTGKTLLGLQFIINGARQGERGLVATLQENPSQLERVVRGFGWSLADEGIEVLYRSPVDVYIDEWVYDVLQAVERGGVRRVLIDSLTDIAFVTGDDQRFREYIYSLIQRLSRRGVSLFMTSELPDLFGIAGVTPVGAPSLCDNIILLRYADDGKLIRRTITVLKTRASNHQSDVREYIIDGDGIAVAAAQVDPSLGVGDSDRARDGDVR
jgi:circadian clock protein KaiC